MSRLKAIEKRVGINLPCPICGGAGHAEFVLVEDKHQVVEPRGCAGCGKSAGGIKIILEPGHWGEHSVPVGCGGAR